MRIVFLCTSSLDYPSPRGRWLPLARRLVRAGHEVHLLMLHPTFDQVRMRWFTCDGVRCMYVGQMHVYGLPGERRHFGALELASVSLRGALALAQTAIRLQPDILHIAKPQPINGLAGVLAARNGARLYVDCDDYEADANHFRGAWQQQIVAWWEDRLPRMARGVSVNTRFLYDRLQRLGVPEQRLCYVPNGVDFDRQTFPDERRVAALRAALGLHHHPTVVYLGAISAVAHGIRLLINAFAILVRRLPAARLVIVGDGDDRPALMAYARARGLARTMIWTGRAPPEAALTWLALGDCSVDPVDDTPAAAARSPLKVVESLAAGVPVVTGDVGDRRDMVGDTAGVIVPAGNAQALADGIATVLTNPALRAQLAHGARVRAAAYDWDRLAHTWQTLYQRDV